MPSIERALTASKARARHAADRVLRPYFDQLRDEIAARPVAPADRPGADAVDDAATVAVPSDFFHNALHELRTIELESVRKGARRALSAGASGRWYFDWFEASIGPLDEHVGVEAFEDEPDDLPDYVTWIRSTADRFDDVETDSIDLVFAGQTTEHLWSKELAGFLVESNRVLADGGQLILDSPNRLVTEHLMWTHGGHSIEISAGEMAELLGLAGFEVQRTRGLWRCRFGDRVLQLEEGMDDPAMVVRRIMEGGEHPDDSFVWWIDAVRTSVPDPQALGARIDELFAEHWDTRACRGMWPGPDHEAIELGAGEGAVRITGLPTMLHAGRWRISMELLDGEPEDLEGLRLDVISPGDVVQHALVDPIEVEGRRITWEFERPALAFALMLRLSVESVRAPVRISMPLSVTALDEPPSPVIEGRRS